MDALPVAELLAMDALPAADFSPQLLGVGLDPQAHATVSKAI